MSQPLTDLLPPHLQPGHSEKHRLLVQLLSTENRPNTLDPPAQVFADWTATARFDESIGSIAADSPRPE